MKNEIANDINKSADQISIKWDEYIDGTIGKPYYYLYNHLFYLMPSIGKNTRILSLGTGAGDIEVDLIANGCEVTGVDLCSRSGEIVYERSKNLAGKFIFQNADFSSAVFKENYDLVISFFSLPFGNKSSLPLLINNISKHMKSGSVFAANYFGDQHSLVLNGKAYGLNQDELCAYLDSNNFCISLFLHRKFNQPDFENKATYWDVFDVIAIKR